MNPPRQPKTREMQAKTHQTPPTAATTNTPGRTSRASLFTGKTDKQLVSAADLAVYLGVSRDFVYAHAAELGGRRLGTGPKARLRFTFEDADLWLTACQAGRGSEVAAVPVVEPFRPRRRRGSLGSGAELLPIRGEQAA